MPHVILVSVSTVVVASVSGEVDAASAEQLELELSTGANGQASALVVDLRRVTFFDNTGLKVLVQLARRLEANRQQLHVVVREHSPTARILGITAADTVMPVHHRVGAALAAAGADIDPRA